MRSTRCRNVFQCGLEAHRDLQKLEGANIPSTSTGLKDRLLRSDVGLLSQIRCLSRKEDRTPKARIVCGTRPRWWDVNDYFSLMTWRESGAGF